jgi:GNAT superfamily N-acetyltransferase
MSRFMVEPLAANELPAAIALLERVGLAGAVASVARYLRWQPDGAWRIVDDGALAGMVTLLRFGRVGFVGCMAVDPAHQGRGLGRRLLEHAHAAGRRAGITTFLLEATESGLPLYTRLGYVDEHETWNVARAAVTPTLTPDPTPEPTSAAPPGPPSGALTDLGAAHAAILALDQAATGSPRNIMIRDLLMSYPGVVEHATGLAAYGLLVAGRIGPVIARDPGAGRAAIDRLAAAALTSPAPSVASVPVANEAALAAFTAAGFTRWRSLRRMRLGPAIATLPHGVWALASPGAG